MSLARSPTSLLGIEIVNPEGHVALSSFALITASFFAVFASLLLPCHMVSHQVSKVYRGMSVGQRAVWVSYCLSQIHAPFSGAFALYCYIQHPGTRFGTSALEVACVTFTLGYMLVDLILILVWTKHFRDSGALLVHHFVVAITYSIGTNGGGMSTPAYGLDTMLGFQIQELTNPFLSNRYFLLECGYKHHSLYVLNGVMILVTFGVLRIGFGSFVLYNLYAYFPTNISTLLWIATVGAGVFQACNYYWFWMIWRKFGSALREIRQARSKTK